MSTVRASQSPVMTPQGDRSLGELVAKLTVDGSRLLRAETELAKRELNDKIDDVEEKVMHAAVGLAVLYAGGLGVLTGVMLVLGLVLPHWLSVLAAGATTAAAGFVMLKLAQKKNVDLAPERTITHLRRDARAMKEAAR